jgi:hypothetical protein
MSTTAKFANHDARTISTFEIIGAYAVETFYNHIWASARANVSNGVSLTDEYVRRVQAYVQGTKTDEVCYGGVVQGVHRYFTATTRFTALSFAEFVDRVVGLMVPEDYFRQFSTQDKDEILSSVLCELISSLAAFATQPDMLRRVIDEHDRMPEVTIRMLQDSAVDALVAKRAALHNKFLRKMGQARDHVSMDVVDDMKKALRRLVREKASAVSRAEDAEEAIGALKEELRAARTREAKMLKLVNLLRDGHERGAAVAGAALRAPPHEEIAEDPLDFRAEARVPRRERIAEPRAESASGDSDASEEDGEDEDTPPSRPARRRAAPKPAAVAADFFKKAAPLAPKGAAPKAKTETESSAKGPGSVTAAQLGQRARQAPAMLTNLLDNVVDTEEMGESELNSILYGTEK